LALPLGLGRSAYRRGDRLQPHDDAPVSRGGWAGGLLRAGAVLGARSVLIRSRIPGHPVTPAPVEASVAG